MDTSLVLTPDNKEDIQMVTKLRLMLDYHCYPVWLYDESGNIIDTLLPEELRSDTELDAKFDNLQERFDALFIDNEHEFSFKGFQTEEEKQRFLRDWQSAVSDLRSKVAGRYEIVDDISLSSL